MSNSDIQGPAPDFSTNVPSPKMTAQGWIAPSEMEILEGLMKDFQKNVGITNLRTDTPQGQISVSMAATIGQLLNKVCIAFNGIDPARSFGVWQDGIGRIFGIQRIAATSTTVSATITCNGGGHLKQGQIVASDQKQNLYASLNDIALPQTGQINIELYCLQTGKINLPAFSLELYTSGLGIISIENVEPGIPGTDAEDAASFEQRRQQELNKNQTGTCGAMTGELLRINDVSSAFVVANNMDEETSEEGILIPPHHIAVYVQGGTDEEIGKALLRKAPAGVPMIGTSTVIVEDDDPVFAGANIVPRYSFKFTRPQSVAVSINVEVDQMPQMPHHSKDDVVDAIMQAVNNGDIPLKIAGTIYASRINQIIMNVFPNWCRDLSVTLSDGAQNNASKLVFTAAQYPVINRGNIKATIANAV